MEPGEVAGSAALGDARTSRTPAAAVSRERSKDDEDYDVHSNRLLILTRKKGGERIAFSLAIQVSCCFATLSLSRLLARVLLLLMLLLVPRSTGSATQFHSN